MNSKQLPQDVLDALRTFKRANGRQWKARLSELWCAGADVDDPALRQARNLLGPSGLYRLKLEG